MNFYGHLHIECVGHLGLTSIEYKENVESRKQDIIDFCKVIWGINIIKKEVKK